MLKILGRLTSINLRKAAWTADELGIPYEREDWGLPIRDPKVPEYLALNPNGLVPVIIDDGFVLYESNAIMRYFAVKHGGLMPADLEGQALVDQWLSWQVGELNPQWGYAVFALLRKNPAFTDEKRIAESLGNWMKKLDVLEGQLAKGPFVLGQAFSLADIAIALCTHRWLSTPIDNRRAYPAIEDHHARMKQRPAGAKYLTEATP